jgi:hypothetical protein
MLPAVNGLRLAVAVVALAAAILGASCSGPNYPDCAIPTLSETAADGGADPCHCDPPPSLNLVACGCLSGSQPAIDAYNACMFLYRGMIDAGAD